MNRANSRPARTALLQPRAARQTAGRMHACVRAGGPACGTEPCAAVRPFSRSRPRALQAHHLGHLRVALLTIKRPPNVRSPACSRAARSTRTARPRDPAPRAPAGRAPLASLQSATRPRPHRVWRRCGVRAGEREARIIGTAPVRAPGSRPAQGRPGSRGGTSTWQQPRLLRFRRGSGGGPAGRRSGFKRHRQGGAGERGVRACKQARGRAGGSAHARGAAAGAAAGPRRAPGECLTRLGTTATLLAACTACPPGSAESTKGPAR